MRARTGTAAAVFTVALGVAAVAAVPPAGAASAITVTSLTQAGSTSGGGGDIPTFVNNKGQVFGEGFSAPMFTGLLSAPVQLPEAYYWATPTTPSERTPLGSNTSTPISLDDNDIRAFQTTNIVFGNRSVVESPSAFWILPQYAVALAGNNADQILVNLGTSTGLTSAEIFKTGTATAVTGCTCLGSAISDTGRITATSTDASGNSVLWTGTPTAMTKLTPPADPLLHYVAKTFINDSGQVAAVYTAGPKSTQQSRTVFWPSPTAAPVELALPANAQGIAATGLNASGQLSVDVDYVGSGPADDTAASWTAGVTTIFGTLDDTHTIGIDDAGQVVYDSLTGNAFVWQAGHTTQFPAPAGTSSPYTSAMDVSRNGSVSGVLSVGGQGPSVVWRLPATI